MIVSMGTKNDTSATPAPAIAKGPGLKQTQPQANAAKAAKSAKAAPKKRVVTFSAEDIARRAYFISEHRQRLGLAGDERSDWIEAEKQLRAEHQKKSVKKATRSKKRA